MSNARQTSNAQHSSASNEHYTPPSVVEAARTTMGGIDLDPASCEQANRIIRATGYFAKDDFSLERVWYGRTFLNPPGGREFPPDATHKLGSGRVNSKLWWPKLAAEYVAGRVKQAIFIGFSIEILQSTQVDSSGPIPLDFPFCIPSRRLDFLDEDLEPQGSPTHANVIVYLPERPDSLLGEYTYDGIKRFREAFGGIGRIVIPGYLPMSPKDLVQR
jgi:hypothetical protein